MDEVGVGEPVQGLASRVHRHAGLEAACPGAERATLAVGEHGQVDDVVAVGGVAGFDVEHGEAQRAPQRGEGDLHVRAVPGVAVGVHVSPRLSARSRMSSASRSDE
ncbi:MAG: hypothetical protein JWP46_3716 [Modestobacter sp.]|nr:hypothetical protein [Modestobacter sp.]